MTSRGVTVFPKKHCKTLRRLWSDFHNQLCSGKSSWITNIANKEQQHPQTILIAMYPSTFLSN